MCVFVLKYSEKKPAPCKIIFVLREDKQTDEWLDIQTGRQFNGWMIRQADKVMHLLNQYDR